MNLLKKDGLAPWHTMISLVSLIDMWLLCDFCTTLVINTIALYGKNKVSVVMSNPLKVVKQALFH